jgi:hypothetical protein
MLLSAFPFQVVSMVTLKLVTSSPNAARNRAARSSDGMNINLTKQLALGIVVQRFF